MSDIGIGKIIKGEAFKDAIHVAVAPIVAAETLRPGQNVNLNITKNEAFAVFHGDGIGIVDPFLKNSVNRGERFYLFLIPGSITSLRHDWTHPAFKDGDKSIVRDPEGNSKRWIEEFASNIGVGYSALMDRMALYAEDSCGQDDGIQEGLNSIQDEQKMRDFWKHYEIVTGVKPCSDAPTEYFRCAC